MSKNVLGRQVGKLCYNMYRRSGHRKTQSVLLKPEVELGSGGNEERKWAGTFMPHKEVQILAYIKMRATEKLQ